MAMTHMRQLHRLRWHQSTNHMEVGSFSLAWSLRSVTNWTRPGHLRRPAFWDGSASCRRGRTSASSGQRPKSTAKKLEGGRGASSAKGEHFPRQSSGVAPYEEDHEISAEKDTRRRRCTTEAASVEATAKTEAADAKKLPKSGTVSASGAASTVRWRGWMTETEGRPREL